MPASFESRIPEIIAAIPGAVDNALQSGADTVAAAAASLAPVETGRLKRAIHVEREGTGSYAVVAGNQDAFYGYMVEYGTSGKTGHPPQPFLIPAFEANREAIVAHVNEELRRTVE